MLFLLTNHGHLKIGLWLLDGPVSYSILITFHRVISK